VLPRDAKTSYCDQDDLEEERDQKRHKKAAEQNLPN
jgi:hypothetical protein